MFTGTRPRGPCVWFWFFLWVRVFLGLLVWVFLVFWGDFSLLALVGWVGLVLVCFFFSWDGAMLPVLFPVAFRRADEPGPGATLTNDYRDEGLEMVHTGHFQHQMTQNQQKQQRKTQSSLQN